MTGFWRHAVLSVLLVLIFLGYLSYLAAQEESAWRAFREARGCQAVMERLVWQGEAVHPRHMEAWRCEDGSLYWRRAE